MMQPTMAQATAVRKAAARQLSHAALARSEWSKMEAMIAEPVLLMSMGLVGVCVYGITAVPEREGDEVYIRQLKSSN